MNRKLMLNVALFVSCAHLNGMDKLKNLLGIQKQYKCIYTHSSKPTEKEDILVKVLNSHQKGNGVWFSRRANTQDFEKGTFTLGLTSNMNGVWHTIKIDGACAVALMNAIATKPYVSIETLMPTREKQRPIVWAFNGNGINEAKELAYNYFKQATCTALTANNKKTPVSISTINDRDEVAHCKPLRIPSVCNPFGVIRIQGIDDFAIDSISANNLLKVLNCYSDENHVITIEAGQATDKLSCAAGKLLISTTKKQLQEYFFMIKMRRFLGVSGCAAILALLAYCKYSSK